MGEQHSEWQNEAVIAAFLRDVREAIPGAAQQLELLGTIVGAWCPGARRILDLGCGDGLIGSRLLVRLPEAQVVFADFSEPMLAAARKRLIGDSRAAVVRADLSGPQWLAALEAFGPVDAVVSGFVIHHLPDARKKALYAEIFARLAPGGVFLNLEQVSSATPRITELYEDYFIESIYQHHKRTGREKPRQAVVEAFAKRPTREENILAPVADQCAWLRDIGFTDVDCYYKLFELAIFGGAKPRS
ncbi:MAG: methyltransferase [Desulfovibrionaceae bacterium]